MIRVIIAAWLLRTTGAKVQYSVRRSFIIDPTVTGRTGESKFRTLGTFDSLKDARAKYKNVRTASTDTITINAMATVAQRHGTVSANTKEKTHA